MIHDTHIEEASRIFVLCRCQTVKPGKVVEIYEKMERLQEQIARSGTYFTSPQRLAIASEARSCLGNCRGCKDTKKSFGTELDFFKLLASNVHHS